MTTFFIRLRDHGVGVGVPRSIAHRKDERAKVCEILHRDLQIYQVDDLRSPRVRDDTPGQA